MAKRGRAAARTTRKPAEIRPPLPHRRRLVAPSTATAAWGGWRFDHGQVAQQTGRHVALGRRGEQIVADHLTSLGWQILERNWRGTAGELDLVAYDAPAGEYVIVEVKSRGGTGFGFGAQAVTTEKYQRLCRLAAEWLETHPRAARPVRIDVASVLIPPRAAPTIELMRGVYR